MADETTTGPGDTVELTEEEWRERLSPEAYQVLRQAGTERAFTGRFSTWHDEGVFRCKACDNPLFKSDAKYESGSGWPSFWEPLTPESVDLLDDSSHGMRRTEVRCGRCHSHLGHLFEDGPKPTGERYCMNSMALKFEDPKGEVVEG